MTDEIQEYWLHYTAALAARLGLVGWTFTLGDMTFGDPYMASIQVVRGRRCAILCLCGEWMTYSPEKQRLALVHELIHCWIEPILIDVEAASEVMPPFTYNIYYRAVDLQSEYAVDGIATAIAGHFPLPLQGDPDVLA